MANVDILCVTNRFAVIQYITKYMTKAGSGSLLAQADKAFDEAFAKACEEGKGIISAVTRFFNKQMPAMVPFPAVDSS